MVKYIKFTSGTCCSYPCQLGLPEDLQPRAILQAKLEEAFGVANQAKGKGLKFVRHVEAWHVRHIENSALLKVQQVLKCMQSPPAHVKETSFTCSLIIN